MSHHFIRYTNVHFSYPGVKEEVLNGISFYISHGERVALLGLNGSGKSTLLLTINGLLKPTSGEINIGDVPLEKGTVSLIRREVGMVFQNADDQLFMPTIEEDIAFGPLNMKLPMDEVQRRVDAALKEVGMENLRKRNPGQLSGGQKRMAAIATVLSMEPNIMVLDEPSASLDWKARHDLLCILKRYEHTLILATHDLQMARTLCTRALILQDGKIAADAPMTDVMKDRRLLAIIGIEDPEEIISL